MKAKIIIVLCAVWIIFNLVALFQNNFAFKGHFANYAGVVSAALLIVSQIIGIKHRQKTEQDHR